jgi:hypothetical protein
MIRFPMYFYSPDGGAGGDGGTADSGGAAAAEGGESWHSQFAYLKSNPEAAKAFAKYKTADDAFKGAHEAIKRFGKPYHLPEDASKLTDEQRAEIDGWHRKTKGVPEKPEGYEFEIPEDANIDEQTLGDFKKLAHERGVDPQTAKDLLGLQLGMVKRLNEHRGRIFEGMGNNTYKTFKNADCEGNADLANAKLENVKKLLQTYCVKADGTPDPEMWNGFKTRHFITLNDGQDRMTELVLLRPLAELAQMKVGTGGSPGDGSRSMETAGVFSYPEMKR